MDATVRGRLWKKHDPNDVGKINVERGLMKLLYALIVFHVKTRDRNARPPDIRELQPLLIEMCFEVKAMLPSSSDFITKHEFVTNISTYVKKISDKRRGEAVDTLSSDFSFADFSKKTQKTVNKKF